MPKGGHARSGPSKDPNSRTSERAGYTLTALPAGGYPGPVPDLSEYMPTATDRHQSIWDELWKMPQAAAWSMQPWRWAQVADLVKYHETKPQAKPRRPASSRDRMKVVASDGR